MSPGAAYNGSGFSARTTNGNPAGTLNPTGAGCAAYPAHISPPATQTVFVACVDSPQAGPTIPVIVNVKLAPGESRGPRRSASNSFPPVPARLLTAVRLPVVVGMSSGWYPTSRDTPRLVPPPEDDPSKS